MSAVLLTDDEVATVVDCFLRSHPWVAERIRSAPDECVAAKIAERELRNSGYLEDIGTVCPGCSDRADREPDLGGWYCASPACDAYEQKIADLDDRGWSAEGYYQGGRGISVSHTPRLGRNAGGLIPWRRVAEHVRGATGAQLLMFG